MKLESALETIEKERQKLKTTFEREQTIFTGIEALDQLLCGFKSGKCYTFIARQGNGMSAFVKTITENINVLYQRNDTVVLNITHRLDGLFDYGDRNNSKPNQKPLLIIVDTSELDAINLNQLKTDIHHFEHDKAVIIFIHRLKDTIAKPIDLNEILNAIRAHSDTIISLFRPKYYDVKHWHDDTYTKQQLECTLLQDEIAELKTVKLFIDEKDNHVQSCYSPSPYLKSLTTRIKAYLEE